MNDIYSTPDADLGTGTGPQTEYPGLRRLPYFLYSVGVNIVYALVVGGMAAMEVTSIAPTMVVLVAVLAVSIYLLVKRLQNLGSSPWWAAAIFVPLLNIWIGLKTLAFPEGYDDHKTLDGTAKVLIGLFVGVFVLGIVAAILIPMMAQ